jgi:hypothetical protein
MKRSPSVAPGATLLCFAFLVPAAAAQGPPQLTVDALAAPSGTTFNNLRSAIAFHDANFPNALQNIAIRGRFLPSGQLVLHGESVEGWIGGGPIVVPRNVNIFWDLPNSDVDALGRRAPVIFSGANSGPAPTAFRMKPNDTQSRANTALTGLFIVAFNVGVEWFPTTAGVVGATFTQLGFNQDVVGMWFSPQGAGTTVDALTTNCKFVNRPQPAWMGGGRSGGLISLQDHVRYYVDSGGWIAGQVDNCRFTSDTVDPVSGAPVFTMNGIYMEILQNGTLRPLILDNEFLGNADTTLPSANGMLYGVYVDVVGRQTDASFTIKQCWFEKCGYDGTMMFAGEQGVAQTVLLPGEFWFEQWYEFGYWSLFLLNPYYGAGGPHFLFPVIVDSSYTANGTLAPLFSPYPEDGHGVSLRTYDFGQLAMRVTSCDTAGTSAGHANVGIVQNARDGVYISSDWYLPISDNFYVRGAMRETRNNSWVEQSELYENGRHGAEARLVDGSGNPGVKGNRIHDNAVNGVDFTSMSTVNLSGGPARTRVFGATDDLANDIVVAQPFAWNNYVYDLAATGLSQLVGVNEFTRSRTLFVGEVLPDVRSDTGIIHDSIVGQAAAGVQTRDTGNGVGSIYGWVKTVVFGDISKFNAGGNPVADIVVLAGAPSISFNCNATYTGSFGNIDVDPLFANRLLGDLAIPATSPCVNRVNAFPPIGLLQDDFDLQPRPYAPGAPPSSYNDMGADEYWP